MDYQERLTRQAAPPHPQDELPVCECIDWYAEGETRVVEVNGVRVTVRFVGRKGRRARIAVTAPAGTKFQTEP